MKLLFLDIDGVLNCTVTTERWNGLAGIDRRLASMFLQWLSGKDVGVVLSSTWRLYDDTKEHLAAAGLSWIGQTPDLRAIRGHEIAQFLNETPGVESYAILDDCSDMLPEQLPFLVQTSHVHGLRKRNFAKLNRILGYRSVATSSAAGPKAPSFHSSRA
jgi:HAD domain in Swiss Army Knife RNA repair proteins